MSLCLTLSNKVSDESWKKFVPFIDGFGTEGIGSMLQYHLLLNFLCDFLEIEFTYPGSKNFSHHSYTGYSENQYLNSVDEFFNFPCLKNEWYEVNDVFHMNDDLFGFIQSNKETDRNILINLSNCHRQLASICHNNVSNIFTNERVDKIRNNLFFTGEKYFSEGINISLHIRTPNPNDIPEEIVSPSRELYILERDFPRYKNLILYLKERYKKTKATLHIHSQGFTTNFEEFLELISDNFFIKLHIDDHPVSDIFHMANSDLFVMSNSSFSWLASLLNSNLKIVRNNFTNGPFVNNFLAANYDYTEIL